MPSEAERRKTREANRLKEELEAAKAAAPSEEEQLDMQRRIAPLARDEDHSFVEVEPSEFTAEELQPDLTKTGTEALLQPVELTEREVKRVDGSTYNARVDEHMLERMTDEQIKEAGFLKKPTELVHPARLAPTSERQRTPYQRSPAAGPGTWPVPEGQLPAVMPSDPPVEDRDADGPGDNTFRGVSGFSAKDGGLKLQGTKRGTVLDIPKNQVRNASALYLRLRQQFPHFTTEMLNDEFAIQYEAMIGGRQSHRPSQELSQHGDTAVGDPRTTFVPLGQERKGASEAQPASTITAPPGMDTGLPSENEPATRAPDEAKEPTTAQDEVDEEAVETFKELEAKAAEPAKTPEPKKEEKS